MSMLLTACAGMYCANGAAQSKVDMKSSHKPPDQVAAQGIVLCSSHHAGQKAGLTLAGSKYVAALVPNLRACSIADRKDGDPQLQEFV